LDLLKTLTIAASGLRAQAGRMRIISENIANADSTPQNPGADPYRRKIPTFRSELDRSLDTQLVELGKVQTDGSSFRMKYEPGHPAADSNGNVKYPNVNPFDRNDGYARRATIIRSQHQCDQCHTSHAPAHHRHLESLKGLDSHG
jgi:flagellar basal-body rod protein FlgC